VRASSRSLWLPAALRSSRGRQRSAGCVGRRRPARESGYLVFTTFTGQPQTRRNLLRSINVASKAAGLWGTNEDDDREPVGAHDLRHSLASTAFELGLTLPEVSRLLRHANTQVTATVYADLAGNAVDVLQDRLSGLSEAATA
jgi:integrase